MKTNQTDKATARPWAIAEDDGGYILIVCHDSKNHCVDVTKPGLSRANAKLIVKAVNEHDALVAVAEAAKTFIDNRRNDEMGYFKAALEDSLLELVIVREGRAK